MADEDRDIRHGVEDAIRYARRAKDLVDEQFRLVQSSPSSPTPASLTLPTAGLNPFDAAASALLGRAQQGHATVSRVIDARAAATVAETAQWLGVPVPPDIQARANPNNSAEAG